MIRKIIIATTNKKKLLEFKEIIKNIDFLSLNDFSHTPHPPLETGETFEENVAIKARYYFDFFKMPVICEDSGFCVEKLNGLPGVHSADWGLSGDFTIAIEKIYELLKERTSSAYFASYIMLKTQTQEIVTSGIITGTISPQPKGDNGFGFDPCFIPANHTKTFAEMTMEEKSSISHRKIAIQNLLKQI